MPAKPKTRPRPRLGRTIQSLRTRAGLSQHALARLAKIDVAVLARLENEERRGVQFETVCRLAEALEVSLDDLAIAAGLRKGQRSEDGVGRYAGLAERARRARGLLERALGELEEQAP